MSFEFNPLVKKGFDKVRDNSDLISDTAYGVSWDGVTDIAPSKNAVYDVISGLAGGHDAVTLDANADTLLSLSTQELGLDTQVANRILAGPVSGADAVPTFRALVADDIPDLSGTYQVAGSYQAENAVLTELTALTDPNADRVVFWNDTTNNFEWKDFANWDTAYGWGNHAGLYEPVGTKANKALDNLASVAINTSLISDTDNTDDLGSALKKWANLFVTNIGATATRVTKGWFTDLEVTNAIAGSITGNAGTVTNATLTTALTVNTGTVTLKGNAANNSVLTIGAGAVSVSGTNTGDQVVPANEAGSANNFLTAYNSATGAWTKARPTWANIDKTTSDIADITTRSHTSLTDIGTLTHSTIDSYLDQAVKTTSNVTHNNLTLNGGTVTLGVDTNFVLSGGVNGVSFDTSTLSVDGTNHRVGVGITAPTRQLHLAATTSATNSPSSPFLLNTRSTGDMADGFGGGMLFGINDDTLTAENIIATIYGIRSGADNSGKLTLNTYRTGTRYQGIAIDSSQVLWIGSTEDTNLYRSAADTLATDDTLLVGTRLGVGLSYTGFPRTVGHFSQNNPAGDIAVTIGNTGTNSDTVPTASLRFRTRDISTDTGDSVALITGRDDTYADTSSRDANFGIWVELDDNLVERFHINSAGHITMEGVTSTGATGTGKFVFDTSPTISSPTFSGGTVTLSQDTNYVLSGGVNGVSFDTNTLSIDATNDRVGVGTTTPSHTMHVYGSDATNPVTLKVQDVSGGTNSEAELFLCTSTTASNATVGASLLADRTDVGGSGSTELAVRLSLGTTQTEIFRFYPTGNLRLYDGGNVVLGTTTGTKIGTATSQKLGFYNATPIVQPTALTAQLTDLTYTAPGTPDYTIQDLTNSSGYGFVTKDEGNTVLSVIKNLQTRVSELETKLKALGLLA